MSSNHYKLNFVFKNEPYKVSLCPGSYLFECWGASGHENMCGKNFSIHSHGGYARGIISLESSREFYVYVGERGKLSYLEVFNGNYVGNRTPKGGGATDVRLVNGSWDDFNSLKSRIIVAGGGGGGDCYSGGAGGGLEGLDGVYPPSTQYPPTPGTQTIGGSGGKYNNFSPAFSGKFGVGGSGQCIDDPECDGGGSGGSGYYGGGGISGVGGGAGGSSYISGHEGCDAISMSSTKESIVHTGQPIHYSSLSFSSTFMIDGNSSMPSHMAQFIHQIGQHGNGFASITYLDHQPVKICSFHSHFTLLAPFYHIIIAFVSQDF